MAMAPTKFQRVAYETLGRSSNPMGHTLSCSGIHFFGGSSDYNCNEFQVEVSKNKDDSMLMRIEELNTSQKPDCPLIL